eukprot:CAMPEP_0170614908 /NCGR_PEP_ID=MMETSP0224-20130122/25054_1 /TAXON_ID=285029 /ORGANISM="Togula jolla, Strain CCCM 725" /LENGTH=91 /DNA_ID=CAMNT_0010940603 /DNA_START=582 /DNA_END=858 /DNA_ORIENTATION=-
MVAQGADQAQVAKECPADEPHCQSDVAGGLYHGAARDDFLALGTRTMGRCELHCTPQPPEDHHVTELVKALARIVAESSSTKSRRGMQHNA